MHVMKYVKCAKWCCDELVATCHSLWLARLDLRTQKSHPSQKGHESAQRATLAAFNVHLDKDLGLCQYGGEDPVQWCDRNVGKPSSVFV